MTQPTPQQPLDYERQAATNRPATLALLFGLLFFLFPFVPGILAVRYGRRGERRAAEVGVGGRSARAGVVLGVINLVLSVMLAVAAPFAIVRARDAALRVRCASNLRQIGMATLMYAADNRGFTPISLDQLVVNGYLRSGAIFACPACVNDPSKPPVATLASGVTHYHSLLPNPSGRVMNFKSSTTVMLYEPLANHDGKGAFFLYWDGHVEWKDARVAGPLIAQLKTAAGGTSPNR